MSAGDVAAALDKGLVAGAMSTAAMTLGSTTEMERCGRGAEVGPGRGQVLGVTPTGEEVGARSDRSRSALTAG